MPSDSSTLRMFQNCSAGAGYKHSSTSPPPYNSRSAPRVRVKFILSVVLVVALTLITVCSIFTEICLSYPTFILSVILSHVPSGDEVVRLTEMLQVIEYVTRVQASSLAFGALVYMWYRVFLVLFNRVSRSPSVAPEDSSTSRSEKFISSVYVPLLLAVVVLNDSIYNQYRSSSLSAILPSLFAPSPSPIALYVFGVDMVPGVLVRLGWMTARALPVCAVEATVLFIILYLVGWCTSSSAVTSTDLEKADRLAPPMYDDDECAPVYDVNMYYIPYEMYCLDEKVNVQLDSENPDQVN